MHIRLITLAFALFVVGVVLLANQGMVYQVFPFVQELPGKDKTGHFFLMGTLAFLTNLSMRGRCLRVSVIRIHVGSLLIMVLVTMEEFSQLFFKARGFDPWDLLSDFLGIFILGWMGVLLAKRYPA